MNKPLYSQAVLVVEDDASLQQAILLSLAHEKITAYAAPSPSAAIDLLMLHPDIHIVWLDHMLSGGNGIEVVTAIKSNPDWNKKIIYVISNTEDEGKLQVYMNLGITHYYTKSEHTLSEIVHSITQFLS